MIKFKASFDDGCRLDIRVADLLEKYGITDCVFYLPSRWQLVNLAHGDQPLDWREAIALSKRFTIGSHTITHPMLTRVSIGVVVDEVVNSKTELKKTLGVENIQDFCYPKGYANDEIRDVVRETYQRARNTGVGNLDPPEDPVWETPTVHIAGVRRREYEGTTWMREARRMLKLAQERSDQGDDVIYHFWGHSWEIERYGHWEQFEDFLKMIREAQRK